MRTGSEGYINILTMQKPVLVQKIIKPEGFRLVLLHHWEYSNSRSWGLSSYLCNEYEARTENMSTQLT